MSVLGTLATVGEALIEHAPIFKLVGEALAAGHPREAVEAAIRGIMVKTAEESLADEFTAAEQRSAGSQGRIGYEAYCRSAGNKNYRGEECPAWDTLPEAIRTHWEAAADAIREA